MRPPYLCVCVFLSLMPLLRVAKQLEKERTQDLGGRSATASRGVALRPEDEYLLHMQGLWRADVVRVLNSAARLRETKARQLQGLADSFALLAPLDLAMEVGRDPVAADAVAEVNLAAAETVLGVGIVAGEVRLSDSAVSLEFGYMLAGTGPGRQERLLRLKNSSATAVVVSLDTQGLHSAFSVTPADGAIMVPSFGSRPLYVTMAGDLPCGQYASQFALMVAAAGGVGGEPVPVEVTVSSVVQDLAVAFDSEVVAFGTVCLNPGGVEERVVRVRSFTGVPLALAVEVDYRREDATKVFRVRQRRVVLPPWREVSLRVVATPHSVGTWAGEDCVLLVGVGSAAHVHTLPLRMHVAPPLYEALYDGEPLALSARVELPDVQVGTRQFNYLVLRNIGEVEVKGVVACRVHPALTMMGEEGETTPNNIIVTPSEFVLPVGAALRVVIHMVGEQEGRIEGTVTLTVPAAPVRTLLLVCMCGRMKVGFPSGALSLQLDGSYEALRRWIETEGPASRLAFGDVQVDVPLVNLGSIGGYVTLPSHGVVRAGVGQPEKVRDFLWDAQWGYNVACADGALGREACSLLSLR
jgi:hypothetical protein